MLRRSAFKPSRKYKPKELERFHGYVAEQGCLVCERPATVHHVRGYADKPGSITRDHWLVVPLCPAHHLIQHGPRWSVEALGHQRFFSVHGIDLYAEATRLAGEWQRRAA
jgi:hypothetical protein